MVNNAGIYQPPNAEEMSKRDKIKAVVDVNVYGVKRVSEAFANHIQRSPEPGRIVNVTSASGPYYVQDMCDGPMKDKLLAKDVNFDRDVKTQFEEKKYLTIKIDDFLSNFVPNSTNFVDFYIFL